MLAIFVINEYWNPRFAAGCGWTVGLGSTVTATLEAQLIKSLISNSRPNKTHNSVSFSEALLPFGLPATDLFEPHLDRRLKLVDFVESLAELHRRIESWPSQWKSISFCWAILTGAWPWWPQAASTVPTCCVSTRWGCVLKGCSLGLVKVWEERGWTIKVQP